MNAVWSTINPGICPGTARIYRVGMLCHERLSTVAAESALQADMSRSRKKVITKLAAVNILQPLDGARQ